MPLPSPRSTHTLAPQDLALKTTLHNERHLMEAVDVPIVTIAATFQAIFPEFEKKRQEIVYSRAHFSQALACLVAASRLNKSSWLVDPSNYVSSKDWPKVMLTEKIAEILARFDILKTMKSILDKQAGGHLPIATAIDDPLLYATDRVTRPILSVHYATGNILAASGKKVLEIVTDPFVRPSYLEYAHQDHTFFAVFDLATKKEFLKKAHHSPNFTQKSLTSLKKRVFVTGPPVDPRIVDVRQLKHPKDLESRPLRLAITTGGVGTNKEEIKLLLTTLAPRLMGLPAQAGKTNTLELILYAGTHPDFVKMYYEFARRHGLELGKLKDESARLRLITAPHILDANELLIKYVFPWADAIVTKPSGDMAYDSVASGCALLLITPIGDWENRIRDIMLKKGCAVDVKAPNFAAYLTELEQPKAGISTLQTLIQKSLVINELYLSGATKIVKTLLSLSKR